MTKSLSTKQIIAIVILVIFVAGVGYLKVREYILPTATIKIAGQTLKVELAKTPLAWKHGLSGRDNLKENRGMLFVFSENKRHAIWMKDMKFPIDIIWIKAGQVVDIAQNVPPAAPGDISPPVYLPREDAGGVLEVNAGFAERYNLKIGDRIEKLD